MFKTSRILSVCLMLLKSLFIELRNSLRDFFEWLQNIADKILCLMYQDIIMECIIDDYRLNKAILCFKIIIRFWIDRIINVICFHSLSFSFCICANHKIINRRILRQNIFTFDLFIVNVFLICFTKKNRWMIMDDNVIIDFFSLRYEV